MDTVAGLENRPNLFNILEAFQRKESWGHQIMRDSCLAVGVNHDKNKERTKARQARRQDLQKFCSNIENMTLKEYIVTLVNLMIED